MKRVMAILFLIVAAAAFAQLAASSGKSDSIGMLGPDGSAFFSPGSSSMKVEEKMAEALAELDSRKRASKAINPALNDSNTSNESLDINTINNTSINSSLNDSSLQNSLPAQAAGANDNTNSSAGQQNIGSSSKGSFSGFYGMTASRHEIGKSGIDSSMVLSGDFEMEKSVKFQDRGID